MTSSTTLLWEELLSSKTPVPMQPINPSFFDEHYLLFVICLQGLQMKDEDEENLHLDEELSLSSTFIQDERIN
jgi:protein tyrosine/serine phosphatase